VEFKKAAACKIQTAASTSCLGFFKMSFTKGTLYHCLGFYNFLINGKLTDLGNFT
jgi:hypothetical protein